MSATKRSTHENGLSKVIGGPGDLTTEMLVSRAEARVLEVREQTRAFVLGASGRLVAMASRPPAEVQADYKPIGDLALSICEVAGAAGLGAIGEVTRGIRAMTEAWVENGVWHAAGFRLHVDALMLIYADPDRPEAAYASVLAPLKHLRSWIGVPE